MVLVDSDVWSEAFRSKRKSAYVRTLAKLLEAGEVIIVGPIRQEVLSGIREESKYEAIRDAIRAVPSIPLSDELFEKAATYFNLCRSHGIQGSHTDYLLCACATEWDIAILTKDKDFTRYATYLPIKLQPID